MGHRNLYTFLAVSAGCVLVGMQIASFYAPYVRPSLAALLLIGLAVFLIFKIFELEKRRPVLVARGILAAAVLKSAILGYMTYRMTTYQIVPWHHVEIGLSLTLASTIMALFFIAAYFWTGSTTTRERFNPT
ncbi:MAG: hypothetical protein DI585_02550 [Pseudomonas fluorescens]|nr:MAG: hypothetical protein DI585_02550 [Pseudomonas fluorescens]